MITEPHRQQKLNLPCPCGSKHSLQLCCLPFISNTKKPQSAEQLMRSRFTAYAIKQFDYVFQTYAQTSRENLTVEELSQDAQSTKWLKLIIHHYWADPNNSKTNENSEPATVEFSAYYLTKNVLFEMREKSRFIFEQQWFYLDGDIIKHKQLSKVKRNDPCPCFTLAESSSNKVAKAKKFKNCCGCSLF